MTPRILSISRPHVATTTVALLLTLLVLPAPALSAPVKSIDELLGLDTTIQSIGQLEDRRDPKCFATASRLEDFMYGTPLSDEARFAQMRRQTALVNAYWSDANRRARARGDTHVRPGDIDEAAKARLKIEDLDGSGQRVTFASGERFTLLPDDYRQYASIAYALRAILAAQQGLAGTHTASRLPFDPEATEALKGYVDRTSLAVLQRADSAARLADERRLTQARLVASWDALAPDTAAEDSDQEPAPTVASTAPAAPPFTTAKKIIAQKIASYAAYNNIATPLFVRNIQVYFARHRWPADPEQSTRLKQVYNEAMIQYAVDLYLGAAKLAREAKHPLVRVEDVHAFTNRFVPYRMNEYEDAIFFPGLGHDERVVIEAYDMDAYRDGGLHWKYLEAALDTPEVSQQPEPDPFAMELLAESIAQFGVLVLRLAGEAGLEKGAPHLDTQDIEVAFQQIQGKVDRHLKLDGRAQPEPVIVSTSRETPSSEGTYFTDVTRQSGVIFEHRMADWLSRLIRSYTVRNKEVAVLAVPPAFGGSGVAAEDVDGDGRPDLLLLGGRGNRLYFNRGNGRFEDVTRQAGIDWRRPADGLPGEPRQPIVADFDNDGRQDILITYVDDPHRLYRNLGDGRFEDVTATAGLGGEGLVGGPAVAVDYDRDGLLDLYIGYFGLYTQGIIPTLARENLNGLPNRLLRNTGNLRFVDVTEGSGVDHTGWAQAMAHTDLDRDGWQDLIVGNDFGINAYYRNRGDGTFVNIAPSLGTDKPSFTMGIGIADLNDDLHPDIYISNIVTMDKDQKYVSPSAETPMKFDAATMARMRVAEANDLFLSTVRQDRERAYWLSDLVGRGYTSTGWSWGADFIDVDNDGDNDLYVTNGMNDYAVYSTENPYYKDPDGRTRDVLFPDSQRDTNVFFINSGGRLHNVSRQSGADLHSNSRAIAYFDMDADGDLDMVLNNLGSAAVVYRNNAERLGNRWIAVKLKGDPQQQTTNDAIGAQIVVTTQDGKRLWREVHSSGAYLATHQKEQLIGLGNAPHANLTVHWPNGQVSRFKEVEAGKRYVIDQQTGALALFSGDAEPALLAGHGSEGGTPPRVK